jgi:hypothetical protein
MSRMREHLETTDVSVEKAQSKNIANGEAQAYLGRRRPNDIKCTGLQ